MSSDGADFEGEEEFAAERPFGGRPFGGRPFGGRPFGGRPFGGRPFGGRPFGGRPFGGRPFGGRPFGGRPFGGRPFGGRPFGGRIAEDEGGFFDADEWSADVAELFCERSAVIRLGGMLVTADDGVEVTVFNAAAAFKAPGTPPPAAGVPVSAPVPLRSADWTLDAGVVLSDALLRGVMDDPEVAYALKVELAEELALAADTAFLQGAGPPAGPAGIGTLVLPIAAVGTAVGPDLLATARAVLTALRPAPLAPLFRNPGWILSADTLDALTTLPTADCLITTLENRSLDSFSVLRLDGVDGGTFLGFPFVTSGAAAGGGGAKNLYFAADWQEAWIGVSSSFVSVYFSTEPPPPPGQGQVIRASMSLDFRLRGVPTPPALPPPPGFAWASV